MRGAKLPARRAPALWTATLVASLLALSCQTENRTTGLDDPSLPPAQTQIVLSDASEPLGPEGTAVPVQGEVQLSGLSVEICHDALTECIAVDVAPPAAATVTLGDPVAKAALGNVEIPAGGSVDVGLTAASATVDLSLTVGGQAVSAQIPSPPDVPVVIEKSVEIIENPDGTRTIRVEIEAVRTISVEVGTATGAVVTIDGDVVTGSADATIGATTTASAFASDVSAPAGVDLSGSVTFRGVSVELFDGEQLSTQLTVVPPAEQAIVIEKEITVTEEGGTLTLRIDIESIQTIEVEVVPGEGATVTVTGEMIPDGASASATAA